MPSLSIGTYIKLGIGLAVLLLFVHDRRVDHLRGQWAARTELMVKTTAEVAGVPKLAHKDAPGAIRLIGKDRDTYYGNWQGAKSALLDQTQRVVALGEETKRLQAESDRQRALVEQLTAQRNGWIAKARQAATRTQRLSAEAEATACDAAMDALYKAGF